jgi:hypothetical protein
MTLGNKLGVVLFLLPVTAAAVAFFRHDAATILIASMLAVFVVLMFIFWSMLCAFIASAVDDYLEIKRSRNRD